MDSQELDQSQEQTSYIVKTSGEPYETEKSAIMGIAQRGLSIEEYHIVPFDEGFAIAKRAETPADVAPVQENEMPAEDDKEDSPPEKGQPKTEDGKPREKYFRVRFDPKSRPYDPERVELSVNGSILTIGREIEVVIPERFVECANHAVSPTFKQMPGEERKVAGNVRLFPFQVLGEATEEEYLTAKAVGDKEIRDRLALKV